MNLVELIYSKMEEIGDNDVHTAIDHVAEEQDILPADLYEAYDKASCA